MLIEAFYVSLLAKKIQYLKNEHFADNMIKKKSANWNIFFLKTNL